MKRTIFFVLVSALLAGALVLCAPQIQAASTHEADHCVCVGSEHIADHSGCEKVQWKPAAEAYSGSNALNFTQSGAYYLTQDESREVVIAPGVEVSLCLNGCTIMGERTVTVPETATLNLCDCTGQGQVSTTWMSAENESQRGWAVKVEKGVCNFYSGTICGKGTQRRQQARSLYLIGGKFRMYGGTITGGHAVTAEELAARGGNVYMSDGTFLMQGGTITGGSAQQHGGNLYIVNGEFNMEKGTVTGGTADTHGGNICIFGGVLKVGAEAVISGGSAGAKGGNIAVIGNHNIPVVYINGTVSGGTAGTYGGNISVNKGGDKGGELYLEEGCVITGGKTLAYGDMEAGGGNLHMHGGVSVIHMEGGTVSDGTAPGIHGGNIYLENGTFEMKGGQICGGSAASMGGNVYVANPAIFSLKSGKVYGGTLTDEDDESSGGNFYMLGTLNVAADGEIYGGSAYAGGNIEIGEGGIVNLNGGQIYDGQAQTVGGNVRCHGSFTMQGGQVRGGRAGADGGNIYVTGLKIGKIIGSFAMQGGSVTGGVAGGGTYGANLAVINAGSAVLEGGIISGGQTDNGTWDVSVGISGIYRGAPTVTLSGGIQTSLRIDNASSYEKDGAWYATTALIQNLTEGAQIRLDITAPETFEGITADESCRELVTSAKSGYKVSYDAQTGILNLKKVNYVLMIAAGAAVVAVAAVVLVLSLRKKKK